MSDEREFTPESIRDDVDVGSPDADSIDFVAVDGDDKVYLYLWDTETNEPVTSVVGFTASGVEKFQDWLTDVDIEARASTYSAYGKEVADE